MKALIQRVSKAKVEVDNQVVGEIGQGILILLGVEKDDTPQLAQRLVDKVTGYRIFPDDEGKMNLNVKQIEGELLVVSQFTLVADTKKGSRPSFSSGASPQLGDALYLDFVEKCKATGLTVATGKFAADMQVSLTNDGPVTFNLAVN